MRSEEEIRRDREFLRHFGLDRLVNLEDVLNWVLNDKGEK
jgi:hypothetical protein